MQKTKFVSAVSAFVVATASQTIAQSLQFLATKAEGDGAVQLRWQSESNAFYQVLYATELLNTNTVWWALADDVSSHGTNTTFLDTGIYWKDPELKHPALDTKRFYRVVKAGTNTLAPPVVTLTTPTADSILSGEVTITATAVSTNDVFAIKFFVDGEEVGEATMPDAATASFAINTTEWPNGPHNIFAVAQVTSGTETTGTPSTVKQGAGASVYVPVTFDNYISKWFFSEPIFEPSLGETQRITATFAAYSTWTLEIRDASDTVVRSGTGEGYSMQFDWDGRNTSGQNLPDGQYGFSLNATETTAPEPPPGEGGGGGLPSLMMAALADGKTSYALPSPPMPPVKVNGKWLPWEEVYGPVAPVEVQISQKAIERLAVTLRGARAAQSSRLMLEAPTGGQSAQAPRRPPPKAIKGKAGTVGVAYQGHHPSTGGYQRPQNLVGYVTLSPNYILPYGPIANASNIASGFARQMSKSAWKTAFNCGNDQLTAPLLRKPSKGGSNLFNYCNIGLLVGHGIRGSSQDFRATSTPSLQTYYPTYRTGVNAYDWVRISECSFGGGPAGLRWMGLYACNMLYRDNALDMYDKGVLPMNRYLHILLAAETSVHMYQTFGQKWASYMNGGEDGTKHTVIDSWVSASEKIHKVPGVVPAGHTIVMTCAYWPDCVNDRLLTYTDNGSTDPSDILFYREQVFPTRHIVP